MDRSVVCHNCGKPGHLKRACKGKAKPNKSRKTAGKRKSKSVRRVGDDEEEEEEESDLEDLKHLRSKGTTKTPPMMVDMKIDDCIIQMEVDTGASVSLMSLYIYWVVAREEPRVYHSEASYLLKPTHPCCGQM